MGLVKDVASPDCVAKGPAQHIVSRTKTRNTLAILSARLVCSQATVAAWVRALTLVF